MNKRTIMPDERFEIDKTAMLLQGLGEAKTEAEKLGTQLDNVFKRIKQSQQALMEHGIHFGLNQITFEQVDLQSAWEVYAELKTDVRVKVKFSPPMMETEDDLVAQLHSVP